MSKNKNDGLITIDKSKMHVLCEGALAGIALYRKQEEDKEASDFMAVYNHKTKRHNNRWYRTMFKCAPRKLLESLDETKEFMNRLYKQSIANDMYRIGNRIYDYHCYSYGETEEKIREVNRCCMYNDVESEMLVDTSVFSAVLQLEKWSKEGK